MTEIVECVACDALVADSYACEGRKVCQKTEICGSRIYAVGAAIRYKFECIHRQVCFIKNKCHP